MLKRLAELAAVLSVLLSIAAQAKPAAAQTAASMTSIRLPFPGGTAWKVLQGYNGGTHVPGPEQYALDLVRDGDTTAGAEVVAPASGTLWFANPPGAGNGCMSIKLDGGGGLIFQMCHMVLSRVMRPDEPIAAGTSLGTIGADGRVGNNGTAHLHISMHRTNDYGITRNPMPFATGAGLMLEGNNLSPDGSRNQFACPSATCLPRLVSTNGSAAPSPTTPVTNPAASPAPTTPQPPRPAPIAPPSLPLRAGVRAVVAGAGDCVNVRESPALSGPVKACLPDGARLRILDGPRSADGYQWWLLEGLGWSVDQYLSAVPVSLEVGGAARVNAQGDCLNVRAAPARAAPVQTCVADGTRVRITGGPMEADGATWWKLDNGGWVSGEFLAAEE